MSSIATVEDSNPKVAPTLTPGKVTPEVLHQWECLCKEYFRQKNITDKKKVESILSRLLDFRIADWAEANEAQLKVLDFLTFMGKLQVEALEKDWDRKIKLEILASKQGERPFHEWAYGLLTRNTLLRGRPCHFDDVALRKTIENNMDSGLKLRMRRTPVGIDAPLRDWIKAVKVEDEFVAREQEMAKAVMKEIYRAEQQGVRPLVGGRPTGIQSATNTMATGSAMQRPPLASMNGPALPKLTPAERAIIFNHQGCFKCHQLYVDHKGANCPNGFPSPNSYKALMVEHGAAVRDSHNKPQS